MTTPVPTAATPANATETAPLPAAERRRFTVDELYIIDEAGIFDDERIELLDGEIFIMPPIGDPHADGTDRLGSDLIYRLYGRARVRVQGPVRLNDYSLPQPDIAVLRLRDDYHRAAPTPADVLLLIEVADSSLESDREVKLPRYAAAGILEVWIVNLRTREVEAYDDPRDGAYQGRRVVGANGSISPRAFPDVLLNVADFLLS